MTSIVYQQDSPILFLSFCYDSLVRSKLSLSFSFCFSFFFHFLVSSRECWPCEHALCTIPKFNSNFCAFLPYSTSFVLFACFYRSDKKFQTFVHICFNPRDLHISLFFLTMINKQRSHHTNACLCKQQQ